MASPSIELKNVTMRFAEEVVLQNISLQIEDGQKMVLIGPSGEGKTVLLKIMAGILPPTEGEVLIDGVDLYGSHKSERLEVIQKMGMLFQKNALFDSLTCGENIAFPMREVTDKSEAHIQDKITYFLEEVQIPHARDLFPDEISGGMQKRLGIARALALEPQIIFYDDPTAGLDPITSRVIIDLICNLQEENNATVVAITNDMQRAYQMADIIGMVVNQELIVTGNSEQTKEHSDSRVKQFIRGELAGPLTEGTS